MQKIICVGFIFFCFVSKFSFGNPFSMNAQGLRPAIIGSMSTLNPDRIVNLFTIEGSQTSGKKFAIGTQLVLDFANRPFPLQYNDDGNTKNVLSNMMTLHLSGFINLMDRLGIGLSVPVVIFQHKDASQTSSYPFLMPGDLGFSDLRIAVKWTLIDNRSSGFGLAVIQEISFPTGNGEQYRGNDAVIFSPQVALDYRLKKTGLLFALNLGFLFRTSDQMISTVGVTASPHTIVSHQIKYAIGIALPISHGFALFTELYGATSLVSVESNIQSPLELAFGVQFKHKSGVSMVLGGGPGLVKAISAASVRAFFGVGYTLF